MGEKTKPSFKAGKEMLRPAQSGGRRACVRASAVPRHLGRPLHRSQRQRLPAGDGAGALPCLRVVGDAREALPQLDRGREFAPLLVDGADRSGIRLGDDEHRWSMGRRALVG